MLKFVYSSAIFAVIPADCLSFIHQIPFMIYLHVESVQPMHNPIIRLYFPILVVTVILSIFDTDHPLFLTVHNVNFTFRKPLKSIICSEYDLYLEHYLPGYMQLHTKQRLLQQEPLN